MAFFTQGFGQEHRQDLRQSQSQVLRQICIQKQGMELRQEITQKLSQNPFFDCLTDGRIEYSESDAQPIDEGMDERTLRLGDLGEVDENGNEYITDAEPDAYEGMKEFPSASPEGYDANDIDNYSVRDDVTQCADNAQERRDFMFTNLESHESLLEHLASQVSNAGFSAQDEKLAYRLIERIDEDGYLRVPFADLVMVCGASEKRLKEVLATIRTFDPVGCGSTGLSEFLLSQRESFRDHPLATKISAVIARHLEDLARGQKDMVCAKLGLSSADFVEILSVIRTLDRAPAQGRSFEARPTLGNPDCHIHKDRHGRLVVTVDERGVPDIRINKDYLALLERGNLSTKERQFLKSKLAEIEAWREALENRGETIRRIVQKVVDVQGDFLLGKSAAIRPLTETQIAADVGCDASTVSRCLKDRVITRPWERGGVVALRSLSTVGAVKTDAGELVSNDAVKVRIRSLIDTENKACPLSDQALTDQLNKEGIAVARRTVMKYREALGIGSSTARRQKI